jgi:prepilin-type N-terminal cleavage/methylation domain-containing protein
MSIHRMRERLGLQQQPDAGFTMAEVLVALMVFSVIAVGMAFALVTMTRLNSDTKSREVAAVVAAQAIDKVRATSDIFSVHDQSSTQTVGNVPYTVTVSQNWIPTSGSTANCGGGGGTLQYKAVQVSVTWANMLKIGTPVKATTDLAPSSKINDPNYGVLIVSVTNLAGVGQAGIGVSVLNTGTNTPASGVSATDVDGCTYVLKLAPGTYRVGASKAGYIDSNQSTSPTKDISVTAGSSQTANFVYDKQSSYNVVWDSNYAGSATLPDSLNTNLLNSAGNFPITSTPSTINLFPYPDGYAAFAGTFTASGSTSSICLSVDPNSWTTSSTINGVTLAPGVRTVAPSTGGTMNIPMGVIKLKLSSATAVVSVKAATPPANVGDPGCAQPTNYTFTFSPQKAANSTVYLAVPFGSWQVYGGTTLSNLGLVSNSNVSPATQGEVTGSTITLDPRLPQ